MNTEQVIQSQLKVLKSFDSNIEIHDSLKELSKTDIQLLIDRRLKDMEADYLEDDLEKLRTFNLLSFFFFAIDKHEQAVRYNDMALDINDRSINALACRAYYHLQWEDYYESGRRCSALERWQSNKQDKLVAKAEVAFAYTKMGIKYFKKAVDKFENVLTECSDVPENYVCSWKFNYALAIRRQQNIFNNPSMPDHADSNFQKVEVLYKEIIEMEGDNIRRYKARACVDLGLEIYYRRNVQQTTSPQEESRDAKKYIEKALLLEPDDDFVLSRSGKYFRLITEPAKSIELLTKALQIKETSFSHHHLALALRDHRQTEFHTKADVKEKGAVGECAVEKMLASVTCANDKSQTGTQLVGRKSYTAFLERSSRTTNKSPMQHEEEKDRPKQFRKYSATENHMRKVVKSPAKLGYFPPDESKEIIQHLDRAFELNNNLSALYDKGLVLRATKQYVKAIDVFKTIVRHASCSTLQLIDGYEQAALCLLQEAELNPSKTDRNELDAKMYLSKSLVLSCELVDRMPVLKRCWRSYPTLKSLLQSKRGTKENLRELANLYRKVKQDGRAIHLLEKILKLEDDDEEKKEVMMEIVDSSLQLEHYEDAILTLRLAVCLPKGNATIDKTLYVKAHIKGGIDAWHKEEKALAKNHLKAALHTRAIGKLSGEQFCLDSEFDVYILSSDSSEEMARSVCRLLEHFGLCVTLNSDNVTPGHMEKSAMKTNMDRSECIAVFLAAEEEEKDIQHMQQWFTEVIEKMITISESDRAKRDPIYRCLPSVSYERETFSSVENVTMEQVSWVEKFLFTVATASLDI